ncbi:MAG TPA: hypothetical protein VGL66_15550 [Caulobacteraceae bacterium]|jgi:hypothetical protein
MSPHIIFVLIRLACEASAMAAIIVGMGVAGFWALRGLWSLRNRPRSELIKLSAYGVLGPITGPLLARVVRNFRNGRPILATTWALAIPLAWAGVASAATVLAHAAVH